jgi:hypothetical protein
MLNPWLSLSFRVARLEWDAQTFVVDQMIRVAGGHISDRAGDGSGSNATAPPTADLEANKPPILPIEAVARPQKTKYRHAAQNVRKIQKKHRGRSSSSR